jgi:hypothetical protein
MQKSIIVLIPPPPPLYLNEIYLVVLKSTRVLLAPATLDLSQYHSTYMAILKTKPFNSWPQKNFLAILK